MLSDDEAAPLKHLLGAKSKAIVEKIVSEVFKQLHAPLEKRVAIDQSLEQALSLAPADAYEAGRFSFLRFVCSLRSLRLSQRRAAHGAAALCRCGSAFVLGRGRLDRCGVRPCSP